MVSVIVPAYNAAQTLRGCLDALLAQDFSTAPYEILVVDNDSTDETWAIIESYGAAVRGLKETKIQSSYAARNAAVRESRGGIIAFTDADCIPDRRWLSQLVEKFADAGVGCVAGEILGVPPTTPAGRFAAAAGVLSQRSCLNNAHRPYAQTANVAYRRDVFDKIGLFEPGLVSGGDVDFCWRMQEQTAWTLCFNEEALVRHHHRAGWKELWRQFERYGRGASALQALYPNYQPDPSISLIE
jgi:cellulose synthase/poly-beta-1,6-N-acetylglucosamine synthase-like glycosyltransferase